MPIDIGLGGSNQVLQTNDTGTAVEWETLDFSNILGQDLIAGDGSIAVNSGGIGATLINTDISVAPDGITNDKIADNAINTENILDGQVQTNDIADGDITNIKLDKTNIPLSGFGDAALDVSLGGNKLIDVLNPTNPQDVATMNYVDTQITATADDDITSVSIDAASLLTINEGITNISVDLSALEESTAITAEETRAIAAETAINTAIALKENSSNKSSDVTLADATNTLFPTELAVKTYVDTQISTGGGNNLSNTDLTQTITTNRTYDINNGNLIFTGNGNVGIGNSANPPSNKLHVAGAIRSQGVLNSDGNFGEPAYRFNGDIDTGIFSDVADELGFSVGGMEAFTLKETAANGLEIIAKGSLEIKEQLIDETGATGDVDDVLTATATGTQWQAPAVVAMGKVSADALTNNLKETTVVHNSTGNYTITFNTALGSADYIIQLTLLNAGAGATIEVTGQATTGFTVQISDDSSMPIDSSWYFTVLDF